MKFSKSLGILIEEALPEWRDKFLSYKDLKKQLKLIYPKDGDKPPNKRPRLADADDDDDRTDDGDIAGEGAEVSKEVTDFVRLLENEMEKFNVFFEEKEEEYVIRWKVCFLFFTKIFLSFFLEYENLLRNWEIELLLGISETLCSVLYGNFASGD